MTQDTINWGEAASGNFPVYPENTYRVRIVDWKQEQNKKGNQQIVWTAEILEGPHAGGELRDYNVLVPQSMFRLAQVVQACKVSLDDLGEMVIGSKAFNKVLNACRNATCFWKIVVDEEYGNNKIAKKNGYIQDETQEPISVSMESEEAPF